MNVLIAALAVLMTLPLSLHAKQSVTQKNTTGSIHFTGKISAPTCTISRSINGQHISTCYRETARNTNKFIKMPLDEMTSELMMEPIREMVLNDPSMQRITLIYN